MEENRFIGCGNMGKGYSWRTDCQRSGTSRPDLGLHLPLPDKVASCRPAYPVGINAQSAQEVAQVVISFRRGKTGHCGESAQ